MAAAPAVVMVVVVWRRKPTSVHSFPAKDASQETYVFRSVKASLGINILVLVQGRSIKQPYHCLLASVSRRGLASVFGCKNEGAEPNNIIQSLF